MDQATKATYEAAFKSYIEACSKGKLGAAWAAADKLSRCPRGVMSDLAILPQHYAPMQEYTAEVLLAVGDRIEQYNSHVI